METYKKLPKNEVIFDKKLGLEVKVNKSASPLFFGFDHTYKITGFKVSGEFKGLPQFSNSSEQGTKGQDDYPLRIGLLVTGDKKLSGIKKVFAADWLVRLYEQLPNGFGLDHVHFFNLTQSKDQVGKTRIHPSSDLIVEEFFDFVGGKGGPFNYSFDLKSPLNSHGIWLSIDGDDTGSSFAVIISKLEFKYE